MKRKAEDTMTDFCTKANDFVSWDVNAETKAEVQAMIDAGEKDKLSEIMSSRLAFGTAGLRGPMGAGFNRMNDLVILQTSQGLLKYLEQTLGDSAKSRGIVVGYDHRKNKSLSSLSFARITAAVFLSQGYKVYLLEDLVATPMVAFGVTELNCAAGIMVTASHNPKRDNGYKVYWGNGAQIVPPHDSGIANAINENLAPWQEYDLSGVTKHPLAQDVTASLADTYFAKVSSLCAEKALNQASSMKIVYTAMHGVGLQWIKRSFAGFGHPEMLAVPSQAEADPEFPTVSFPNPEEKGALDQAMSYAESVGAKLIIANDPDADRLAAAEFQPNTGKWHLFSGNEIGVLLGQWQIMQWKKTQNGRAAVLSTAVSSRMLKKVAEVEGVQYCDTLTGFKWIGNRSLELQKEGVSVLFSYEEALGYCVGDVVCDKDGVSAAAVFAEMAHVLENRGSSIYEHLETLQKTYGKFMSYNSYVICHDPRLTDRIFERLRKGGPGEGYWEECAGAKIAAIKDITVGYDSTSADKKSDLPMTPESHMIMYTFDNGVSVTLRTSGTEPKIKFYTELAGSANDSAESIKNQLSTFVDNLVDEMLQPTENGLVKV